jgi:flagellar biosynthesis protein FliQ
MDYRFMGKLTRDLIEHSKEISWVLSLVYIFLGFIVLIFGRSLGYVTISWISAVLAALVTIMFGSIVIGNLLLILVTSLFNRFLHRVK